MADASGRRRGHGEDAIYIAADKNRYIGAVSVGFGPNGKRVRRKVSGKTKQEVRDSVKPLMEQLGIRSLRKLSAARCSVGPVGAE